MCAAMAATGPRLVPLRLAAVAAVASASLLGGATPTTAMEDLQRKKAVTVSGSTWQVRTDLQGGDPQRTFRFGRSGDIPILGDWDGTGRPTPGVVRDRRFHLNLSLGGGAADKSFAFGRAGDTPLVGDWNGDGRQTIGIRRGNTFHLRNQNAGGPADISFNFGRAGDTPIVGDWNGDGRETVGVVRGSTFHLRNRHAGGAADISYTFGRADDEPVAGDWNGDGRATAGIVRGNDFHLTHDHSGGGADHSFRYGTSDDVALLWSALSFSVPLETWDALAQCESNGNWSANTGNGFYGGIQFNRDSWDWAGGQRFATWPHQATRLQQIATGERLREIHPNGWGAWPHCSRHVGLR